MIEEHLHLICSACGNRCMVPPSRSRAYACPRCAHLLARADGGGSLITAAFRRLDVRACAHYALMLAVLLGAGAMAVRAGLRRQRPTIEPPSRPPLVQLTAAEINSYNFRLRQLEQDLKRDGTDFEVLRRLGQLHLQLAACRVENRSSHLRQARHYLLLAGNYSMSRWDSTWIRELLGAANTPNPAPDTTIAPGEAGPPPRADEELTRWLIGMLEAQVSFHRRNSRLLRRLAERYVTLYMVMDHEGHRPPLIAQGASMVSDPDEVRLRADFFFHRAQECARTDEERCRALYGASQLYRVSSQPGRAAAALRQLLVLEPNNWLASMEMAALCRQLNHTSEAEQYQRLSVRWRTPGWI